MASASTLALFKETRIDLEPTSPRSTINIQIPAHGQSHRSSRLSQQRRPEGNIGAPEDEDAFARRYLATSGAVYFRQKKDYPRSFLWRILEDQKVLELRSIDLTKSEHDKHEATLTLRLVFANPIRKGGVVLSDREDHDLLSVFVLTKRNELHTLSLRPDAFCRAAVTEGNVQDWCKSFVPASFSISKPHRLLARGPHELWISLHDGRLLRLTRKAGDDGTTYRSAIGFRADSGGL